MSESFPVSLIWKTIRLKYNRVGQSLGKNFPMFAYDPSCEFVKTKESGNLWEIFFRIWLFWYLPTHRVIIFKIKKTGEKIGKDYAVCLFF